MESRGGGVLNKVLYVGPEAPTRGAKPYPFICLFLYRKSTPIYLSWKIVPLSYTYRANFTKRFTMSKSLKILGPNHSLGAPV